MFCMLTFNAHIELTGHSVHHPADHWFVRTVGQQPLGAAVVDAHARWGHQGSVERLHRETPPRRRVVDDVVGDELSHEEQEESQQGG